VTTNPADAWEREDPTVCPVCGRESCEEHLPPPPKKPGRVDPWQPVVVRLADVAAEPVSFIWPGHLARKKLHVLAGDPGLGKTHIALDSAARMTRGAAWPDGGLAPHGDVLLLTAEDNLADTIRPRLDACQADVSHVHALTMIKHVRGPERMFSLAEDLPRLEQAIDAHRALFVVIDPVSAYLPKVDTFKDNDVRSVLAPLAQLADRKGVAVQCIMHLGKSTQRPAMYRVIGSIAFVAAARIVHAVAAHPDDDTKRVLVPVKANICAPSPVLAYRLEHGAVVWDGKPVDGLDVEALLGAGPERDRSERRIAEQWLSGRLLEGYPVLSTTILEEARQTGISRRTLFRAKAKLGIDAVKVDKHWYWRVPLATA